MSDYGDFCREQRERKQVNRHRQFKEDIRFLDEMVALGFTYAPVGSAGFRLSRKDYAVSPPTMLRIDFWPSTGKWNVVGTPEYNVGGRKMIHWAKAHTTKEGKAETQAAPQPIAEREWRPTGPGNPPWDDCPCDLCKGEAK